MSTKTQIGNLALRNVGVSQFIANLDTETSPEAVLLRNSFDVERDYVLRHFPWPFASSYATLALVAGTSADPVSHDWIYAYRLPSDCLLARRIVTAAGRREKNPPSFEVGRDSGGRLVYTDQELAQLKFTARITDPAEFDAMFVSALAWRLGAVIAAALSKIEGMAKSAMEMYLLEIDKAQVVALNEQQRDDPDDAEWIVNR